MNKRTLVISGAVVLGAAFGPQTVLAHARLTKSAPAADARLAALPVAIRLWYSEAPEIALTRVVLTDSAGHVINVGPVERDQSTLAVHVAIIGRVAAGRYKVAWKTAGSDGHPSQGSFTFVVLPQAIRPLAPPAGAIADSQRASPIPQATPGADDEPTAETPAYVAARTLAFASLLAMIGVVAFRSLVLERSAISEGDKSAMAGRAATVGVVAAVCFCASALARLYLQAAMMSGPADSIESMIATTLTLTRWGDVWVLQAIAGLSALISFASATRDGRAAWVLATIAATALSAAPAFAGHAIASVNRPVISVTVDTLHVIGASGWLGGLLCLLSVGGVSSGTGVSTRWDNVRTLVEAFSPTALGFATVVVVTGTLSAWLRLGSLPPLWTSAYGKVLLVKLGLLVGVAVIGLYNWRRVRPALHSESAVRGLRLSASVELAFGFFVLLVTAILVALPTPPDVS